MKRALDYWWKLTPRTALGLLLVTWATGKVNAAHEPLADGSPVMDGAFTSATEYARAIKERDVWNVGWYYNQSQTNWNSTNTLTFFKMHAFDDPAYGQLDLYDLNSFEFVWSNTVVQTWVFLAGDEYATNDPVWLGEVFLTGYSALDDDGGFLVRLNNDPTTDRRWHPGDPEPGQPGWDFAQFYGVFARGGFNNSSYVYGYNNVQSPRELYEWSITLNYLSHPGGGSPPTNGIPGAPGGGGGGGNPLPPGLCDPIWTNVVVTNTVKDWKPKMGGHGTLGGIGWVVVSNWVFMGWDTSKHPFVPVVPAIPGPLGPGSLVTAPGNILTYAQPGQYVVVDDSPATPGRSMYDIEILQLDIAGGTLPPGMIIREGPVLLSPGHALVDPRPDGQFQIDSFFDVFTEISLDGGGAWYPATNGPARLNLGGGDPSNQFPSDWFFPTEGQYTSPESSQGLYSPGIVISNLLIFAPTATYPMPLPGQSLDYTVDCMVELDLSEEGGVNFSNYSAPGTLTVTITNVTVEPVPGPIHFELPVPFEPALLMANATNDCSLSGPGGLLGAGRFIKQNSGALTLDTVNDLSGGTLLAGGTLAIGNDYALGTGPLTLSHGTLQSADTQPRIISNHLVLLGDPVLGAPGTGPLEFIGPTADLGIVPQTLTIDVPVTMANALTNTGGLVKAGLEPLTLTGENTFTGPTTVSEGPLQLAGSGSLAHSTPIIVHSVLDASQRADGTLSLNEGQTLAGDGGVTAMEVLANAGATLSPGASIGMLTFSPGNLVLLPGSVTVMELDKAVPTNDVIRLTGAAATLTFGGTLSVTNLGAVPLEAGDSFPLFSASQYLGAFDTLVPVIPAPGLAWDTSTLSADGTLRVLTGLPAYPTNITAVLLGGNMLQVSWPESHQGWILQAQTNAPGLGLGTNWFPVPGSTGTHDMLLPIDPASGSVFYRLAYPYNP